MITNPAVEAEMRRDFEKHETEMKRLRKALEGQRGPFEDQRKPVAKHLSEASEELSAWQKRLVSLRMTRDHPEPASDSYCSWGIENFEPDKFTLDAARKLQAKVEIESKEAEAQILYWKVKRDFYQKQITEIDLELRSIDAQISNTRTDWPSFSLNWQWSHLGPNFWNFERAAEAAK